ncbi:MAG TPA: ribosome biogenesis GTPase Der [Gammaproteobacteria bacterium]|nr:ribosome biogenesis GTPase Der [Gammaproteobacteria bacterium]
MLPVIAIVGRPNVGKSTLFNRLTASRDALVADVPGLTRDRQYGFARSGARSSLVVDTGGLTGRPDGLDGLMARQTQRALDEADAIVFLVDARDGLSPLDETIAGELRRRRKPVYVTVNKAEGIDPDLAAAEFHALGLGDPWAISAAHGERVGALLEAILEALPEEGDGVEDAAAGGVRVAVVGRPNVGKSTLINRLLGEERLVTFDEPGTTRDSVEVPFERDGRRYVLIDTAGLRRRGRVVGVVEKFSVIKTLQAVDDAHVVIAMLDAREGVTEQDAHLLGLCVERGRAAVVAVNKWDGLTIEQRDTVRRQLDIKLGFMAFAPLHFISALHGTGVGELVRSVDASYAAAVRALPTPELNRVLEQAVAEHAPPMLRGRRIRLRYAHQGGRNPPLIVVHGTQAERLPAAYRRYLVNRFRAAFDLAGTPLRIELKSGANPFAGRRNKLTPRQERKRKRLKRHVKR